MRYFQLIFEFLKMLKNEVLEKSNTQLPAPPIKNDLTEVGLGAVIVVIGSILLLRVPILYN